MFEIDVTPRTKLVLRVGGSVGLDPTSKPKDPVLLNTVFTPVTTAFKTNNPTTVVNTIVVIKTVVQVDVFVQATVNVVNSGEPTNSNSLCGAQLKQLQ